VTSTPAGSPSSEVVLAPRQSSNSVSVVIPVYNGERHLGETLRAVLNQTVRPAEVIVVDDGSTDSTAQVARSFGGAVTLVRTPNQGACKVRNLGASHACSEWIALCDHDDLWLPTKLEKQLRLAQQAPEVQCVITDYAAYLDGQIAVRSHLSYAPEGFWQPERLESGWVIRHSVTGKLTLFQPAITSTQMVRRSFYQRVGGFDPLAQAWADDTCFHVRCLSVAPFGVVPEVLMHYRRRPGSLSADELRQLENTVLVWEYMLKHYPQVQPFRVELRAGLELMRVEVRESRRYRRRQKLKKLLPAFWRS